MDLLTLRSNWSKPSGNKSENLLLGVLLLAALLLRLWGYSSFSYSNDELSALTRLKYNTFHDLVTYGFYTDGHPGGIQVFLWIWSGLFGLSEASLRFPFVLMGVAAVYFAYRVGKRMAGPTTGLFTAASIAFLPFPLLFSQIARPYGSGLFFAMFLAHTMLNAVYGRDGDQDSKIRWTDNLLFVLALILCMYNHYFSFLFAGIVGFTGLFIVKGKRLRYYVIDGLLACFLFLPHLTITLHHLSFGGLSYWLGKPSGTYIFEHIWFLFDQSIYTILVFALAFAALCVFREVPLLGKEKKTLRWLSLAWFLLPVGIGYIYSLLFSPVLQNSVLIFTFPFFFIFLFGFAEGRSFNHANSIILILFLMAGTVGTVSVSKYYNRQHFGEFKKVAQLAADWNKETGRENVTNVISVNHPNYIHYYLEQSGVHDSLFRMYDIPGTEGLDRLAAEVKASNSSCFLFAWTKPVPSECEDIIRGKYPFISKRNDFSGLSAITLFSEKEGSQPFELPGYKLLKSGILPGDYDASLELSGLPEGEFYVFDTLTEYGKAIEIPLGEELKGSTLCLFTEAEVLMFQPEKEILLVVSVESEGKPTAWKGMSSRYFLLPGEWNRMVNTLQFNVDNVPGDTIKIYFWNKVHSRFLCKNLKYFLTVDESAAFRKSGIYSYSYHN